MGAGWAARLLFLLFLPLLLVGGRAEEAVAARGGGIHGSVELTSESGSLGVRGSVGGAVDEVGEQSTEHNKGVGLDLSLNLGGPPPEGLTEAQSSVAVTDYQAAYNAFHPEVLPTDVDDLYLAPRTPGLDPHRERLPHNPYKLLLGNDQAKSVYYDPIPRLPGPLQGYASDLFNKMYEDQKCTLCRGLVNLILDDVLEVLPDLRSSSCPEITRVANRVLLYICDVFGPGPNRMVCDAAVGLHFKAITDGLCDMKDPYELCTTGDMKFCLTSDEKNKDVDAMLAKNLRSELKKAAEVTHPDHMMDEKGLRGPGTLINFTKGPKDPDLKKIAQVLKGPAFQGREVVISAFSEGTKKGQQKAHKLKEKLRGMFVKTNQIFTDGVGGQRYEPPDRVEILVKDDPLPPDQSSSDKTIGDIRAARIRENEFLCPLGDFLRKVMEPFKCPVCKMLVGFTYDELAKPDDQCDKPLNIQGANRASARYMDAWTRVCNNLGLSPWDIVCDSVLRIEAGRDGLGLRGTLSSALTHHLSPKEICYSVGMCFSDGVTEGTLMGAGAVGGSSIDDAVDDKLHECRDDRERERKEDQECACA